MYLLSLENINITICVLNDYYITTAYISEPSH